MKTPPQPIVRALQSLLGCVEPSGERGVLAEQGVDPGRQLPGEIWDGRLIARSRSVVSTPV